MSIVHGQDVAMERVNYLAKRVVGLEEFKTLCRNEKVDEAEKQIELLQCCMYTKMQTVRSAEEAVICEKEVIRDMACKLYERARIILSDDDYNTRIKQFSIPNHVNEAYVMAVVDALRRREWMAGGVSNSRSLEATIDEVRRNASAQFNEFERRIVLLQQTIAVLETPVKKVTRGVQTTKGDTSDDDRNSALLPSSLIFSSFPSAPSTPWLSDDDSDEDEDITMVDSTCPSGLHSTPAFFHDKSRGTGPHVLVSSTPDRQEITQLNGPIASHISTRFVSVAPTHPSTNATEADVERNVTREGLRKQIEAEMRYDVRKEIAEEVLSEIRQEVRKEIGDKIEEERIADIRHHAKRQRVDQDRERMNWDRERISNEGTIHRLRRVINRIQGEKWTSQRAVVETERELSESQAEYNVLIASSEETMCALRTSIETVKLQYNELATSAVRSRFKVRLLRLSLNRSNQSRLARERSHLFQRRASYQKSQSLRRINTQLLARYHTSTVMLQHVADALCITVKELNEANEGLVKSVKAERVKLKSAADKAAEDAAEGSALNDALEAAVKQRQRSEEVIVIRDAKIASLAQKSGNDDTTISSLRTAVNDLDTIIVARDTAISSLQSRVDSLDTIIVARNTTISSLRTAVNDLDTIIVARDTTISSLRTTVNDLNAIVVTRNTTISSLKARVDSLSSVVDRLTRDAEDIKKIRQSASDKEEQMKASESQHKKSLKGVEAAMKRLNDILLGKKDEEIEALKYANHKLSRRVNELEASLELAQSANVDLKRRITVLEQRAGEQSREIKELTGEQSQTIKELTGKVEERGVELGIAADLLERKEASIKAMEDSLAETMDELKTAKDRGYELNDQVVKLKGEVYTFRRMVNELWSIL